MTQSTPESNMVAGFDLHLSERNTLAVEFRKLWLDASFGAALTGTVKAGGNLLLAAYRRRF
jgi:hypothetical protein